MRELPIPPVAYDAENAVELVRIWVTDKTNQFIIEPYWTDPTGWGLIVADLIRHASMAYGSRGHDADEAYRKILVALRAELMNPTDPTGSKDHS